MPPLSTDLRRLLEKKVVEARDVAELAATGALKSLAVDRTEPFPGMAEDDREFRRVLRARARQLGRFHDPFDASEGFVLLVAEIAYEQWHRMLFARFLAENGLLMHPEHGVAVTLKDCAELAPQEGEPDEWMLAARFAAQMLPGIFRTTDPAVRVRFAPEGRQALERILAELPTEVFAADDSLGWVYQFWQTKKKKEVNASERKIGGADLPPVTQLFTEHYMVAFLLENSLGAWWAGRHPESPLLKQWEYLRFAEDGTPAAGSFQGWPERVAEVTMMDPCTGSGHFLVTGFHMIRRMREEEEGLAPREAADAVLRDNLFGLEIDGRCVQIAVFALALEAWKVGGYRELPSMNIACSGVPARGTAEDWRKLAGGDQRLEATLERLYHLFKDADTLGSLIDPRRVAESDRLTGVDYEEVAPLLQQALSRYGGDDPAQQVFAHAAEEVATAAKLLAGRYTLVATNPPFLGRGHHNDLLRNYVRAFHLQAGSDLATCVAERWFFGASVGRSVSLVLPQSWLFLASYGALRKTFLVGGTWNLVTKLGAGAFETISGEVVQVCLASITHGAADKNHTVQVADFSAFAGGAQKAAALRKAHFVSILQSEELGNPNSVFTFEQLEGGELLEMYASAFIGLHVGDWEAFRRNIWEASLANDEWRTLQNAVGESDPYSGLDDMIYWPNDGQMHRDNPAARVQGKAAWGKQGVAISMMAKLPASLYGGGLFRNGVAAIVPKRRELLPAIWAYCSSPFFGEQVRKIDPKLYVTCGTLVKVPFDLAHWQEIAAKEYPNGLPEPESDDATQWIFHGRPEESGAPLRVALARLLGYRWPAELEEEMRLSQRARDLVRRCTELAEFADSDGIVCLPPIGGERPAADRLLELLAAAYGDAWSQSVLERLLADEGAFDLATWLRDDFFSSHCRLFHHRPFIWHIWDSRKDGFAALINYHKLDRKLLERLIYTTLQSWIDRQKAEAAQGIGGAEARLVAATQLKEKLEFILAGEPPFDIYVRWKPLERQPIGWDPDINDGVRLNVRPFVTASVLRSKFNVKWDKDRGKNPDGSERLNDLHFTVAEKREARAKETSG